MAMVNLRFCENSIEFFQKKERKRTEELSWSQMLRSGLNEEEGSFFVF